MTQGRTLIAMLKRKSMTSLELLMTGVSVCWWKRVAESLNADEELRVVGRRSGVNVYAVRRVERKA